MNLARFVPVGFSLVTLFVLGITPAAAQCENRGPCITSAVVDGVCVYTPAPTGTSCGDNTSPCFHSLCDGAGHCIASQRDCDDGNPCTDDMCRVIGGQCDHTPRTGQPCNTTSLCPSYCGSDGLCHAVFPGAACDDQNPCTADWCYPETGCVHVNQSWPCFLPSGDMGVCHDGTCAPVPPPLCNDPCNDGNNCTVDSCDPSTGCVFASNGTCGNNPETLGYWNRLCAGPHPSGEFISVADVNCVKQSCTFSNVGSVADVCNRLQANAVEAKCEKSEAQFMALLLNVCRGRVAAERPIRSHCSDLTTVGASSTAADSLLCDPFRDHGACAQASCMSEEINSGKAK